MPQNLFLGPGFAQSLQFVKSVIFPAFFLLFSNAACCRHVAAGRLSFCPEVAISGHQSRKSEPQFQKSKPTSRLLTSPQLTSPHLTSPQLTSAHLSSPQLTSPHLTSRHLTSPHVIATATHPSMKESTQGGGAKRRAPVWILSLMAVWLWL